jgi:hypothetical protein
MALTIFLFKVANINQPNTSSQVSLVQDDQSTIDTPTTRLIVDENAALLSAKVTFRGIN